MNDRQILASPNWYNSSISDISVDGVFAFGGKNSIFLLDLTGPEFCQYFGQLCGHKDRVTSVDFCKTSAYSRCCVSTSEDQSVVIWDVDSKTSVSKHNGHQTRITAVCWSQASHDWIFSGDEKGRIFLWNHQQNEVYEHVPLTGHINCISCPPDEENLVVVGYKTGQIIVLLLQKGKQVIVNVLKGHNDEIHSLVWSPVPASELPTELFGVPKRQETGYILASGSRDKTIRLWDISLGQFFAVVHVPNRSSNKKTSRDDHHIKSRLWNTLCWPQTDPNCLISSGFNGDILAWNLSKNSKQKWQLFNEGKHSRIVFNICHYAVNDVMISVSMDRLIHIWSRRDAAVITSLPSCGGFVYSLHVSVLDPSRLAVGVGDNMIRIWETKSQGVTNLWRGIGTKVMKVLWHPEKEGVLAFGTEEGKVGIYNVISQTCNVSRTYHRKSVYSLSWGPPSGSSDDGDKIWHLYSCGGEGTILEHKPEHLHDEAKSVEQLIKTTNVIRHNLAGHSEVSWVPDRSLMAVGNEDGSIKFYRFPDLKLLSTVSVHNKSITCLAWYHDPNDSGSTFLASGSNGSDVHVHDMKYIIDGVKEEQKVITTSYRWLAGHSARVTNVVWSPHSFSKLASSSYDGTVEVWDVVKGEALVNYRGHSGRVMTVAWSLMDPDVLFSGSDDFTLRSWRISQQVFKEPPEGKKFTAKTKAKNKKKKTKTSPANEKTQNEYQAVERPLPLMEEKLLTYSSVENEIAHDEKEPVSSDVTEKLQHPAKPQTSESTDLLQGPSLQFLNSGTERNQDIQDNVSVAEEPSISAKVDSKKKKRKGKSMFPLSASADNKTRSITSQECVDIAKYLTDGTGYPKLHIAEENLNLGLFADRTSAFNMLSEEGIHHAESGNMDYQLQLEIWKGNIGKALELAVEKRQLTDWLVAISHLAGERVRLAVTEAFAEQLVSQGNYHKAALYYLACHKVYESIRMFRTAGMYREAIALAKVRLLPSDPLLLDLYSSWGRKLEGECCFELASKCYLACGLHDDAIRVLTRRADENALHSAAQIAKLSMKIDLSQSLILQCALMATKKAKWNDAFEMIQDYPDMQPFLMLMFVHKTILSSLLKSGAFTSDDFPEIQNSEDSRNLDDKSNLPNFVSQLKDQYERRTNDSTVDDSYSVCKILERWWSDCGLHMRETRLPGFYVQISTLGSSQNFSTKEDIKNIFMIISKNICLGLAAALLAKPDICIEHFLKAIMHCHDSGYHKLLCHLVKLLFPFGLESWYMIKCLSESYKECASSVIDQYFCNIMAFYYRAMLTYSLNSQKLKMEHDFQDPLQQNSFRPRKDADRYSSVNTIAPSNVLLHMGDVSCYDGQNSENIERSQSHKCSLESPSVQSVTQLDFSSNTAKDYAEVEVITRAGGKEETAFKEIYRIALVCSTVLLSDIHVQFQKSDGNITNYVTEQGEEREKTELEILLTKIPFPNVMESARMLVNLLNFTILSKETSEVDNDMALQLSRQVTHWVTARKCEGEIALGNVNDHKLQ